jgi:hypothetical protein
LEGRDHDLIDEIYRHLLAGTDESHKKKIVKPAGDQAEIQTQHPLNKSRALLVDHPVKTCSSIGNKMYYTVTMFRDILIIRQVK